MIVIKRFKSDEGLYNYLDSNRQYEVMSRIGISGTVVLLTDEYKSDRPATETVDEYINNSHYEHSNIHYRAYYGEY